MTRKALSLALASVLSCTIAFGADSNYTTEGKEKVTRNGMNFYVEPNSPLKERILSGKFDKSLERMKKAYEANKNNEATKAAAPPVSAVYIIGVCSSQMKEQTGYDCEEIPSATQTETIINHGGNPFEVITGVVGYGGRSTDSATFAGNQATMIECQGAVNNSNIVYGWLEVWDISKPSNTNGTFTYTARSINVGPTMSASIYIK